MLMYHSTIPLSSAVFALSSSCSLEHKHVLRSFIVVFPSPGFDDDLGMEQAGEPVFDQAFIP